VSTESRPVHTQQTASAGGGAEISAGNAEGAGDEGEDDEFAEEEEEDVTVMVEGKPISIHEVTVEDEARMSKEVRVVLLLVRAPMRWCCCSCWYPRPTAIPSMEVSIQ
jgi:hypothetical protein